MNRKAKQTYRKLVSIILGMLIFLSGVPYMGAPMVAQATAEQWVDVGSAGVTQSSGGNTMITIDNSGTPYVAFSNGGNPAVKKYNGSAWVNVGSLGFGGSINISIAIDSSGTPYVAFGDGGYSQKATVKKYNGSSWVNVGSAGFSAGVANYTSIAIDSSGTPYVVYSDGSNSNKATVMKYDGSSWVNVGSAGFSAGVASNTSMAIDSSGTPYVVYWDAGNSYKATVKKYNGSAWVNVGSAGVSAGNADYTRIAIDSSGTLYVVFKDYINSEKATVMKYNGSSWVNVGSAGFSEGPANQISIVIDSSGTPYVVYQDWGNNGKATVMKYNGSSWVNVGSAGFSADRAESTSIAIDSSGTPYVVYSDGGNNYKVPVKKFTMTCTVTYNGNFAASGSAPTDSTIYQSGYTATVQDNTGGLVKTGYTFAGWNTKADGTGTDYVAGVPITIGSTDVTLYAKWTATNAATPNIGTQPTGATVNEGASSPVLSVAATVSDSGTLSYQWYSNTTSSNSGGTGISGATSASYAAPTLAAGTMYYYVVVTNTNSSATGSQTATATSSVVSVTVNALTNAATPSIGTQPTGGTVNEGASSPALSVAATVSDSGTLSYQWYSNTTSSNSGGTAISGATSASYAAPTLAVGTTYYYVVVTNTNSGATGSQTATATSSAVSVTVNALTNATTPSIDTQPTGATANEGASSPSLSVAATVSDSGTLSYQWYSNAANSTTGGTAISGATSASYAAPTLAAGTTYYYVVVSNTNSSATGSQTATATSSAVSVTVNALTNAATPSIDTQPTGATANEGASSPSLSVAATVSDSGTLSYQWYSNAANSTTGGTAISGATSASYAAPTLAAGTTYYYVVVTNTNSSATGSQTATVASSIATVTVNALTNVATPIIGTQPTGATVNEGASSPSLSVAATVSDNGTLSYQWYSNTTSSNSGGTAISGETSASYAAPTLAAGTTYYYVVVTNTNSSATGSQTATATSSAATVTVNALINAATPSIGTQPTGATVNEGASSPSLSVTATVSDSGTLSYQWYSNTTSSNSGGAAISGATSASYAAPTTTAGTTYYYVVVTNTNSSATGSQTATVASSIATVTVNALTNVATPIIGTQPTGATVNEGASSPSLSVAATVSDNGTLSYQWYSNTTSSNSGGTAISGETSASYAVPTATAGTTYYYVVVTNTNSSATGSQTATATSSAATVTVNALTNAATPSIGTQPTGATVNEGASSPSLSVTATVSDSGTLSYQWYSNTTSSNSGGAAISGATSASYAAPTLATGTTYYYVVVTNTNSGATGSQTATVTSNVAKLTINAANSSAPTGLTAIAGNGQVALTWNGVSETVTYSVYKGTASGSYGLTPIATVSGVTYSYTATGLTNGTTYYFAVKASNARGNSGYSNEVIATPQAAIPSVSSNANLSSMAVSGLTLSSSFDTRTFSYTASVGNGVTLVTVTPTISDSNATVKVNGTAVTSGQASGAISLNVGNNPITMAVTAQDGKTTQTYTVIVTRAEAITASSTAPIQVTTKPVSITVAESVTNAEIAVATTTAGSNKEATLPLVEVQAATTLGNVSVTIPDGTKITAPANWDGAIKLPQVQSNSSVTVNSGNVSAVIEVGSTDVSLTFDKAVRLLFPNQKGKQVGFVRNGVFTEITGTVSADTQAAADSEIAASGDAKMTVGSDLVIWTKHFTKFVSYTQVDTTSTSGTSGGGGGAATNYATITAASGGTATLNGVTIEVPAGAMASNIQVTVDKVNDISILPVDSTLQLISEVYEIKKDKDGDFSKPVVITLPFDKTKADFAKSTAGVYWLNEQTHKWVPLEIVKVDEANGTASGSVSHFTKFAVLVTDKAKTVQPQTNEADFADIKGHWSEANVRELVKLGAINGYADNTFKPNANITRAEFVTVIVKAFHLGAQDGKTFVDTETHWAKSAIATAAESGIVAGYSDNSFGPDDLITREQMAAIVVHAAKLAAMDKSINFPDSADISDWARTAIATATAKGLINGYGDGTVKPKVNTTRAEAVTVILRALQAKP